HYTPPPLSLLPLDPPSTLFPYTTLFRSSDFYEEDEPVEKVRQAFARGDKGATKRPRDLNQLAKSVVDHAVEGRISGVRVRVLTSDRKSTRLNSSHRTISYAVFCSKKKKN